MNMLHIWPEEPQARDGEIRLAAVFEGLREGTKRLELAVPEAALPQAPLRADHFALAALFPAMSQAEVCIIHGPVSRSLLANLEELNAIWQMWRPEKYRRVEWQTGQVVDEAGTLPRPAGHLFAFSGGVDACATLLRHSDGRLGWRQLPIGAAVMVHGFDIRLTDGLAFKRAFVRAEKITSSFGARLIGLRTNIRDLPGDWEDLFAANLAAVLHVFSECHAGGVLASDETFKLPLLLWGSNPVANPFLGSTLFPVRTDGAELTRLEKVMLISRQETLVKNIRVCWEGNTAGANCGVCEKCVRTQLELLALGIDPSGTFEEALSPGMVVAIHPRNRTRLAYLAEILDYADQHGLGAWWVAELRQVVRRGLRPPAARFQSLRQSWLWKTARNCLR